MKYLNQFAFAITAFLFTGPVQAQDLTPLQPFNVKGSLTKFSEQGKMVLIYATGKGRKRDTVNIVNGHFEIKGSISNPGLAYLSFIPLTKNERSVEAPYEETNITFYLDPGDTKLIATNNLLAAKISGGPSQKDWLALKTLLKASSDREHTEDVFIENHPISYLSWDIIKNRSYLNEHPEALERLFNMLDPQFKNSKEGQQLGQSLALAKTIAIGKPALDFILSDTSGKAVSLKSFRGKYVLVDFWASWCGPCRAENPNVLKAYQQLKDKDFEVVAVSLDNSRASWMKAIHEDKMPWTQLSDLQGWKSKVALQYDIRAIPQNFLLDPNGIIIAKNLRGINLHAEIGELINK